MALIGGLDFGGKQLTLATIDTASLEFSGECVEELPRGAEDPWNKLVPSSTLTDRSATDELRSLQHHEALHFLRREYRQLMQNMGSPYPAAGILLPYASGPMIRTVVRQELASVLERRGNARAAALHCWEIPVAVGAGFFLARQETTGAETITVVSGGENAVEWTRLTVSAERIVVNAFIETSWEPQPDQLEAIVTKSSSTWLIDERLPTSTQQVARQLRRNATVPNGSTIAVLAARGAAWLTAALYEDGKRPTVDRIVPRSLGMMVRNSDEQLYWMTLAHQGEQKLTGDWERVVRCGNSAHAALTVNIGSWVNGQPPGDWVRQERWQPHVRWWQPATMLKSNPALEPSQLALSARQSAQGWQVEAAVAKTSVSG